MFVLSSLPGIPRTAASCAALVCLAACSDAPHTLPSVSSPPPAPVDGVYRVSGTTVEVESGIGRRISGLVVLRQKGAHYSTHFELSTEFRHDGRGEGMSAEVVGQGTGKIDGSHLHGTARTQLVLATVPGVDSRFAFLPRQVGPKIVSDTVAEFRHDGTIEIAINSRPDAGHEYARTRTELVGHRVGDVGHPGKLPELAALRP